jgi:2'-5' RNA ligase
MDFLLNGVVVMRLFIAINFTQEICEALYGTIQKLKSNSVKGNFTRQENLHLTLAFIGDTTKVTTVKQVMDCVNSMPIKIKLAGLGKFPRPGGDIYWVGVEKNEALDELHNQLVSKLIEAGFTMEKRPYKPHLTLGRRIIPDRNFDLGEFNKTLQPISFEITMISLMKSERLNGKLIYTELYSKKLK